MNARVIIRPAVKEDQDAISRLRIESLPETGERIYTRQQRVNWATRGPTAPSLEMLADGCVLVGICGSQMVACIGLDLDKQELLGLFVSPAFQKQGLGRRMVVVAEQLAVQFGLTQLRVQAMPPESGFYRACGYTPTAAMQGHTGQRGTLVFISMSRSFPQRQTHYGWRISNLLKQIGIPADYGIQHRLRLQPESRELATIGIDALGREHMLHPEAAMAWYEMRHAAEGDDVILEVASAFRSVGYQVSIVERKHHAGQSLAEILRVSAAPGYSEHHTGRALDINSPGTKPFEENFENTAAFEWLTYSAGNHGFRLSYPRNNRHGIAYEPWHWFYQP